MDQCATCRAPAHSGCGKCKRVAYCSVECQHQDWARHRITCQHVGRETAAQQEQRSAVAGKVSDILGQFNKKTTHLVSELETNQASSLPELKKRANAQNALLEEALQTLQDVLQAHGAGKDETNAVLADLQTMQDGMEEILRAGFNQTNVASDAFDRASEAQVSALNRMQELCRIEPEPAAATQKKADDLLDRVLDNVVLDAGGRHADSEDFLFKAYPGLAEVLYSDVEDNDEPLQLNGEIWDRVRDYLKSGALAAGQNLLRRIVHCLGWGPTFPAHLRGGSNKERHDETMRSLRNIAKNKECISYEAADYLLRHADGMDKEMTRLRASNATPEVIDRQYRVHIFWAEVAFGFVLASLSGWFWMTGVTTYDQARRGWDSSSLESKLRFEKERGTYAEMTRHLEWYTNSTRDFYQRLESDRASYMQQYRNNMVLLREPFDVYRNITALWVERKFDVHLDKATRAALGQYDVIAQITSREQADGNLTSQNSSYAVGFFNPINITGVNETALVTRDALPPALQQTVGGFFDSAKQVSVALLRRGYKKDPTTYSTVQKERDYSLGKKERDWQEREDRFVRGLAMAIDTKEVANNKDFQDWMRQMLDTIGSQEPGLAYLAARRMVNLRNRDLNVVEAQLTAANVKLAHMGVQVTRMTEGKLAQLDRLKSAEAAYKIEQARIEDMREKYAANFPKSPFSAATIPFMNLFRRCCGDRETIKTMPQHRFFGSFYPVFESSYPAVADLYSKMSKMSWSETLLSTDGLDFLATAGAAAIVLITVAGFFYQLSLSMALPVIVMFIFKMIQVVARCCSGAKTMNQQMRAAVRPQYSMDDAGAIKTSWVLWLGAGVMEMASIAFEVGVFAIKSIVIVVLISTIWANLLLATQTLASIFIVDPARPEFQRQGGGGWFDAVWDYVVGVGGNFGRGGPALIERIVVLLMHWVLAVPMMRLPWPRSLLGDVTCWNHFFTLIAGGNKLAQYAGLKIPVPGAGKFTWTDGSVASVLIVMGSSYPLWYPLAERVRKVNPFYWIGKVVMAGLTKPAKFLLPAPESPLPSSEYDDEEYVIQESRTTARSRRSEPEPVQERRYRARSKTPRRRK